VTAHIDKQAKFGQVAKGYRANLLLLTSNLLKDMSVLRKPEGIMQRGNWYINKALNDMITW